MWNELSDYSTEISTTLTRVAAHFTGTPPLYTWAETSDQETKQRLTIDRWNSADEATINTTMASPLPPPLRPPSTTDGTNWPPRHSQATTRKLPPPPHPLQFKKKEVLFRASPPGAKRSSLKTDRTAALSVLIG